MAYATIGELVERMALPATYSDNAALVARLTDALDEATAIIDNDTGRNFATRAGLVKTFTVGNLRRSGRGVSDSFHRLDILDLPDLTVLTTLKVDDNDDGVYETTIASTGYELGKTNDGLDGWPYSSVRLLDREFPTGGRRERRIEITASFGWAAVPTPINKACTLLAARLSAREASAVFGLQSFGADGGGAYIRNDDPDYMSAIARYKMPQVA